MSVVRVHFAGGSARQSLFTSVEGGKSEHHRAGCPESIGGLAGHIPQERIVSQKTHIPSA